MEKKRVSSYRVSPPGTGAKLKKWVKSERCNIDMFEILQQPEQKQHKSNSGPDDTACHRPGNDIIVQMTRLVPHNPLVGRQGSQCQSCEGIHNEIYPKHLSDCQRRLCS